MCCLILLGWPHANDLGLTRLEQNSVWRGVLLDVPDLVQYVLFGAALRP